MPQPMPDSLQRILLVEDEADIRTIALTVLEAVGGFAVVVCASGEEAIQRAPEAQPDLIILDVMMPGLDGPATMRRLRELPHTARTPVMFMTAKAQASEIRNLLELGALDVITKPFDPMKLPSQIRDVWQRHAPAAPAAASVAVNSDPQLDAFYGEYADGLPAVIEEIEQLWTRAADARDVAALKPLHRALHSLAGSAGTFGFVRLGAEAKALENALTPYLGSEVIEESAAAALDPLFQQLRAVAAAGRDTRRRA